MKLNDWATNVQFQLNKGVSAMPKQSKTWTALDSARHHEQVAFSFAIAIGILYAIGIVATIGMIIYCKVKGY